MEAFFDSIGQERKHKRVRFYPDSRHGTDIPAGPLRADIVAKVFLHC
jgi:hypothetical protein